MKKFNTIIGDSVMDMKICLYVNNSLLQRSMISHEFLIHLQRIGRETLWDQLNLFKTYLENRSEIAKEELDFMNTDQ